MAFTERNSCKCKLGSQLAEHVQTRSQRSIPRVVSMVYPHCQYVFRTFHAIAALLSLGGGQPRGYCGRCSWKSDTVCRCVQITHQHPEPGSIPHQRIRIRMRSSPVHRLPKFYRPAFIVSFSRPKLSSLQEHRKRSCLESPGHCGD